MSGATGSSSSTLNPLSDAEVQAYYDWLTKTQNEAVAKMLRPECQGGTVLAAELGTGKTRVSLLYAKEAGVRFALIVAPLQTEDGWREEAEEQLPHLEFKRIQNSAFGLQHLADFKWRLDGIYFIGQEYFVRLGWVAEQVKVAGQPKFDDKGKPVMRLRNSHVWDVVPELVVHDESHRQANCESRTHRTMMNLDADYKIAASGTFFGNNFDGAYAPTKWVYPHLAEKNIYAWRKKWALTEYDHFKPNNERTIGEKVPGAFFKSLPSYVYIKSIAFPQDNQVIKVELPPQQRRLYDQMEERMVAWVDQQPVVAELPIVQRIRLRQSALGAYYINENGDVDFEDDCESIVLDTLQEILAGEFAGEKVLAVTDSQRFARVVAKRIGGLEYSGKVARKKRIEYKTDFVEGDAQYLVGTIAAMGTGTNGLQRACRNIVWLSESENGIDNEQTAGRLPRTGQLHVVRSRKIVPQDTLADGIMSRNLLRAIDNKRILTGGK